jgi:hypothetical protein
MIQRKYEALGYEGTGIALAARFDSDVISLQDAAAFFTFLSESMSVSLAYFHPEVQFLEGHPRVTTNVTVTSGSIEALVDIIKGREFKVGIASSLAASIVWAAATFVWPANVHIETNVPKQEPVYRVPIDPQLGLMVASLNATGKPWVIEFSAVDPRYPQGLKLKIRGNQRGG